MDDPYRRLRGLPFFEALQHALDPTKAPINGSPTVRDERCHESKVLEPLLTLLTYV